MVANVESQCIGVPDRERRKLKLVDDVEILNAMQDA